PLVASAPDGLYQLLQQLNGIFFIPIASILLAGFFLPQVSATAAKTALLFGLGFYILCTFILEVDIHFVHIWGIEFVLNISIMLLLSRVYPRSMQTTTNTPHEWVEMQPWPYTKAFGIGLSVVVILIYILLGNAGS
ncbi:MAG: solute:sodium symporter family transporter, partial [Bacteroidota bacterium]